MAKLTWHDVGEKYYETGIKDVVLYVIKDDLEAAKATDTDYENGQAWNGVTSLSETPSGGEANDLYADDDKYLSLYSEEQLGASLEAYTYPEDWGLCDGSAEVIKGVEIKQQSRKMFGLSYITTVGNDTLNNDAGEKLHILYGCKASPSDRSYTTINDSPEAITFSWELTTTKQEVPEGYKKTCLITIDTTKLTGGKNNATYKKLKAMLQGVDADSTAEPAVADAAPYLPRAKAVIEMFANG